MINTLISIASHLTTESKYKGHGYWLTYEDDKIKIVYHTYHPDIDVWIKIDGVQKLVLKHSYGHNEEYHPGAWEKYTSEVLHPKAVEARRIKDEKIKERAELQRIEKFGPIDDSKVFAL